MKYRKAIFGNHQEKSNWAEFFGQISFISSPFELDEFWSESQISACH